MSLDNETSSETTNDILLENSKKLLRDYKIIKQRLTQIITNHILPSDEAIEQALTLGLANRDIIEREVLEAELNEILELIPKDEKITQMILTELDQFDLQSTALENAVKKSVRKLWIQNRVPHSTRIRFELSAKNEFAGILGLTLFDDKGDEFCIKYATLLQTSAPYTTKVILAKGSASILPHANGGEFEAIPQDYVLGENEYEATLTSSEIYANEDGIPQYMYHSLLYSFCKVVNDEPYRHFLANSPAWFEIDVKKMPLSKINFTADTQNALASIDKIQIFLENESKKSSSFTDMQSLESASFEIKNFDYESAESIITKENLSAITNEIINEALTQKDFVDTKSEQTISGKKTFSNIHVANPTEETQAAPASYVMNYSSTLINQKVGTLDSLTTTAKDSLVNAINEINAKEVQNVDLSNYATKDELTNKADLTVLGDLNSLSTTAKDSLVNAINEVKSSVGSVEVDDSKITEAVESVAQDLIGQTLSQVSNINANVLSTFISAIENKTLLCNITNTDAPALTESGVTGYKQGFVWVNESVSPQKMWVSDITSWLEVNLTKINTIDKLVIKASRNNVATSYSAVTLSNFGLITADGSAIFAKSSSITSTNKKGGGTCVFEINGVDYTATLTTDLTLYGTSYTFDIVNGNDRPMLSSATTDDGIYHYTLTFDKALPTESIQGFGIRPYGNVVGRDWSPKIILEAYNSNISQPIFSLEKSWTANAEVDKSTVFALSLVTGTEISKKVTSYSDWTEVA